MVQRRFLHVLTVVESAISVLNPSHGVLPFAEFYTDMIARPTLARRFLKYCFYNVYYPASSVWRKLDHIASWREVQYWIGNVPDAIFTGSTYNSYANWMHNQGFFSALFNIFLKKENPHIFDFGCGMGNLAPVCHHFVQDGGHYWGVDVDAISIEACHKTYRSLKNCSFYLTSDKNAYYAQTDERENKGDGIDWPVKEGTQDLLIAMSVFTHLQEPDSIRYLDKIHRILGDRGMAIISFLIVRDYVNTNPLYNLTHPLTPGWFTSNLNCPEMAIGITHEAIQKLIGSKFKIVHHIEGSVTGGKRPSLQDIMILEKIGK